MTAPLCEMLRNSAEFWKGGIRELAGQGTIAHQVSLSQAAPGSTQAALRAQARALRFRQTPTCPLISYRWPSMLNLGGAKTGSKLVPVFYGLIPTNTYTYLPEIAAITSPIILMYSHSWFIR